MSAGLDTCNILDILVKDETSQSCESAVFFDLSPDIIDNSCEFKYFFFMTPKAAIIDAGDTLLLFNVNRPGYLHCNEHNNVPIPIVTYEYTAINRSLLCDWQL